MATKRTHKKQCGECGPGRMIFQEFRMVEGQPKRHHKCDSCEVELDLDDIFPREEIIWDSEEEVVE